MKDITDYMIKEPVFEFRANRSTRYGRYPDGFDPELLVQRETVPGLDEYKSALELLDMKDAEQYIAGSPSAIPASRQKCDEFMERFLFARSGLNFAGNKLTFFKGFRFSAFRTLIVMSHAHKDSSRWAALLVYNDSGENILVYLYRCPHVMKDLKWERVNHDPDPRSVASEIEEKIMSPK